MIILGIDTASGVTHLALYSDGKIIATLEDNTPKMQAAMLLPHCEALLRDAGVVKCDISLIACNNGPGGFTSVRVGVATANALAFALDCPAHGESAFEVMAYDYEDTPETIYCAVSVGRDQAALHQVTFYNGLPRLTGELTLVRHAALADYTPLYADKAYSENVTLYAPHNKAISLVQLTAQRALAAYITPAPLYAKAADAIAAKPLLSAGETKG